jgi:hypothetical protein
VSRRLTTNDISRVEVRQSDSLLNGALVGAGAAIASGLFLCTRAEPWRNCRDDVGPMLRIGAIGAGVGIGIDALIRGRQTIYGADRGGSVRVAPVLGRDVRALQLRPLLTWERSELCIARESSVRGEKLEDWRGEFD